MHGASSIHPKIEASHEPDQATQQRRTAAERSPGEVDGRNAKQRAICSNPGPEMAKSAWLHFRGRLIRPSLDPIAGFPNEQDKGGDHANHDKHPVLHLEAQNGEMLDQKLHRSGPPFFGEDRRFSGRNVLFIYF
jgi:hypothetical protein